MVKIDLGAHMDGYIVVAAHTVIVKEAPVAGNSQRERCIQTDTFLQYFLLFLLVYHISYFHFFPATYPLPLHFFHRTYLCTCEL